MAAPLSLAFNLTFDEAIAAARARGVKLPDAYYAQLQLDLRIVSTTVSGLSALDQIEAVIESVINAISKGQTFGDWQRMAGHRDWNLPRGRLETVFRTNVQTAYSAGHWAQFQENAATRPYLMWSAINDSRVRPTHLAMDGYIAPLNDPIWKIWRCPADYSCRCKQISLSYKQAVKRGLGRQSPPTVRPGFAGGEPGNLTDGLAQVVEDRLAGQSIASDFLRELQRGLK